MKIVTLSIILLFLAISPCLSKVTDYIVAVVNAEPITLSMAEYEINALWVEPSFRPKTIEEAIQKLVDHKLKLQEARRRGIFVTENELLNELSKVSAKFESSNDLANALNQSAMTLDYLKEKLNENIMIQKMIDRKFGQFIRDSDLDGEATNYFEQHKSEFIIPESVLIDQIFFEIKPDSNDMIKETIKNKAEEALIEIKNGANISKYTNNPKIGYDNIDELNPEIKEAINSLNIGQISDIIETKEGYFIIKLNDRRASRQALFNEVKEQIITKLRLNKIEAELQVDLKKQRENADIRINYTFDVK